jgi:hypothetical protein
MARCQIGADDGLGEGHPFADRGRFAGPEAVAQEAKMNPIDITPWIGDWVWSLLLIVLTVVIHVCGLAIIGAKFVDVLSDSSTSAFTAHQSTSGFLWGPRRVESNGRGKAGYPFL